MNEDFEEICVLRRRQRAAEMEQGMRLEAVFRMAAGFHALSEGRHEDAGRQFAFAAAVAATMPQKKTPTQPRPSEG